MNDFLPYDPGATPSSPPPSAGEAICLRLDGPPPYKDRRFSIRNVGHKIHSRFVALRKAATQAMAGRAPYRGPVGLVLVMYAPEFEKSRTLTDYVGGIMDSLDGSHGVSFTYLPIAYEDDCQVASTMSDFHPSTREFYELSVHFLPETIEDGRLLGPYSEGHLPSEPLDIPASRHGESARCR